MKEIDVRRYFLAQLALEGAVEKMKRNLDGTDPHLRMKILKEIEEKSAVIFLEGVAMTATLAAMGAIDGGDLPQAVKEHLVNVRDQLTRPPPQTPTPTAPPSRQRRRHR